MGVFDEDAEPYDLKGVGDDDVEFDDDADSADDIDDIEDEDDLDDDYDDLDLEDATDDDIDFVVELHREDGQAVGSILGTDLANDLDELITQLSRLPGDAGTVGFVSINGEFFVICRVRGQIVQVLLSDGGAANDWPIARDVVEYLGLDVPDEDDDPAPVGDLNIFADSGLSAFDLEMMIDNLDDDSDVVLSQIMTKLNLGREFDHLVDAYDSE